MRQEFLPFHRPSIGELEIQEVTDTLRSGWVTTGPKVKQFEGEFADYVGSTHAVALNSGTAALHLALSAIGLESGDEVIVPTNTFTATAEVVTYFGATPVMVDCRRDTFNIDEQMLEERITHRTKAVIPVHMAGQPCQMDAIMEIAAAHDIRVIEDAAHALPSRFGTDMVGTIGDITAFSFYATKTITTGEGGMATTDNEEFADRMRVMSLHGISKDAWKRYTSEGSWYYEVVDAGYKYNMTDVAAAMGIAQLTRATEFRDRRADIATAYNNGFADLDAVRVPIAIDDALHAWHLYIILIDPEALEIDRARFVEELRARNIGSSVHFIPLHLHPFYQSKFGHRAGDFVNAEWVYERCISLPIFPDMTDGDVTDVIEAVHDVARTHRR